MGYRLGVGHGLEVLSEIFKRPGFGLNDLAWQIEPPSAVYSEQSEKLTTWNLHVYLQRRITLESSPLRFY
jgi:hypothetical protein